ncbi:MAG: adenosine deaminase [Actinomycetota bacterium]
MSPTEASAGRSLRELPKCHLHLHLDGSFPRAWVRELAARQGMEFAPPPDGFADTDEFFRRYVEVPALVRTLDDLAAGCRALVESEAANGVVYMEPGVEPQLYSPRLGSLDDVLSAMWDGFQDAAGATGVEVGCLIGVNTDFSVELAETVAAVAAARAGDGVVAFGTAGFVEPAGLHRFRRAVGVARSAGLRIVAHAGQTGGPESVTEALDELHPDRIAHGIHAARDPSVLSRLAEGGVVCDVALTSNVALRVVESYERHPLPKMLDAKVPVTLNADDELWFGSNIVHEYELARDVFGLSEEALASIALAGTRGTGASPTALERCSTGIEAWLSGG